MSTRLDSTARLLGYARRYRFLLATTIAMGILGFAVVFVFPWLIGSVIDKVVTQRGDASGATTGRSHWLMMLLSVGAVTALISSIAVYGRGHLSVKLGNRIITDLREDLFDHLSRLSLHFYSREPTGSIVSRIINDIQQASQIISGGGILILLDLIQMAVAVVLLLSVNWRIGLACMATLPLYALTFKRFNPRVKAASDRVQNQISRISGTVQERLSGIALVKASATEESELAKFKAANEEYYGRVVEQSSVSHLSSAISEGLIHTGTLLLIGLGGFFAIYGKPPLTAGQIVKLLGWMGIMYGPVRHLAEVNIVFQTSMAALSRVFRVFAITPKIVNRPNAITQPPARGELIFDHVKFCYTDGSEESQASLDDESEHADPKKDLSCEGGKWILDDLSFQIAPGERVALVGPSGSGKSTLASLLPRLYDVTQGRILIDGVDVRDYRLKTLRSSIGIVQQQSLVFSGTIRENLCYGCNKVDPNRMIQAAKDANAHEFISGLEQEYEAMLGERGANLSGGQLQRISIARALLRDPKILILDEATSALDTDSEALVQEALERAMKGRTCFIIAHRLSTIRNADRILVLQAGRLVEAGKHEELVARDGLYARLVRQQFGTTLLAVPSPAPPLDLVGAAG